MPPTDVSVLFTMGNIALSAFNSNQIRDPVPETPEPIQKTHLLDFVLREQL